MDLLAQLEKHGLEITYEMVYPKGGGQGTLDRNQIRGLGFPLTADDWCDMCMRDGPLYMGGCCGQTSAIQDLMNEIFRDSGYAESSTILDLMQAASKHDGFEDYSLEFSGDLGKRVAEWKKLNPIERIGVCCQAAREKLKATWLKTPHERTRRTEEEDWCHTLEGSLRLLSFRDLVKTDSDKSQKHANREELLARILPAAKKVLEAALPKLSKPFRGFAVVKGGTDKILSDGYGLCIYESEKKAKSTIALWKKHADEDDLTLFEKIEIKPVTISAKTGIVWK